MRFVSFSSNLFLFSLFASFLYHATYAAQMLTHVYSQNDSNAGGDGVDDGISWLTDILQKMGTAGSHK